MGESGGVGPAFAKAMAGEELMVRVLMVESSNGRKEAQTQARVL